VQVLCKYGCKANANNNKEDKKMELMYVSTRDANERVTASQAILKGLASDGGLFVPTEIPTLDVTIEELAKMSYQETAYEVMKKFLTDFTEEELKYCINSAYDSKFDTEEIAPLVNADGAYYLELFHGSTIAFKDMALSILPYLLTTAAKKNQVKNDIVILTATSGDTGKAALAGFADVAGTKIIVFYPKNGVSPIQEKQMVTQKGDNTFVVGIHGNFDQAQTGVKQMFSDAALAKEMDAAGYQFSSANSINIGRLVPQIVYYVYSYAQLFANGVIAKDEKINVAVPTGNFGNILAAFYAKNMGLPISKLICASNENKVLFDFFTTGTYDKNREFMLTSSPSMDILISSNLERLIYRIAGNDAKKNASLMKSLSSTGKYEITPEMKAQLEEFYGNYTSEAETAEVIHDLYEKTGYIIDTHTAVATGVYHKYIRDTKDTETKTIIASTASPFKFTRSVMNAIDHKYDSMTEFELVDELSRIGNVAVPQAIEEIRNAKVRHDTVCEVSEMPQVVKRFLKM
jgi:threonine synthase